MEKGLNIASKILITITTLLTTIFFVTYFVIFFKSGGFAYKYRILILVASFVLILFNIANIAKQIKNEDKKKRLLLIGLSIINILISAVAIYYYFTTPEKYIKQVNIGNLIFVISYLFSCIYISTEKTIEKKTCEENYLKAINPSNYVTVLLMILFLFFIISTNPKSYPLNLMMLFMVFISYIVIIKNWDISDKCLSIILIVISTIIYFVSGICFRRYFDTIEKYTLSTFCNAIALIFTIMSICLTLDKKEHFVKKVMELVLLTATLILFMIFSRDKAVRLEHMKRINIYRIISIFLVYIYIIKNQVENIIKKNVGSIVISTISLVLGIVFMILTINKADQLYYIFFKQLEVYAMVTLIVLVIEIIYQLILNRKPQIATEN